jgi:hypothetical protein
MMVKASIINNLSVCSHHVFHLSTLGGEPYWPRLRRWRLKGRSRRRVWVPWKALDLINPFFLGGKHKGSLIRSWHSLWQRIFCTQKLPTFMYCRSQFGIVLPQLGGPIFEWSNHIWVNHILHRRFMSFARGWLTVNIASTWGESQLIPTTSQSFVINIGLTTVEQNGVVYSKGSVAYGGFLSHGGTPNHPRSSKSWTTILVLKSMVTGYPHFRNPSYILRC